MYKNFFKRFFDFWISLIALICICPILLVVTIWLHFANKGNDNFNVNLNLNERKGWLKHGWPLPYSCRSGQGKVGKCFSFLYIM